jgi:MurNAc alpha-1-phosphate uridylyltransferase
MLPYRKGLFNVMLIEKQELAGLILAAGRGERLRPLTDVKPKPLMTIGLKTLLDIAIESMPVKPENIIVNAWYMSDQIVDHLRGTPIHVVVEQHKLGSAGTIANIRTWLEGRPLMIRNADMWFNEEPTQLWEDWTGENPRLLVREMGESADFGTKKFLGWSLLPAEIATSLKEGFSGLLDTVWKPAYEQGRLELIEYEGVSIDCGTIDDLEAARAMAASTE